MVLYIWLYAGDFVLKRLVHLIRLECTLYFEIHLKIIYVLLKTCTPRH